MHQPAGSRARIEARLAAEFGDPPRPPQDMRTPRGRHALTNWPRALRGDVSLPAWQPWLPLRDRGAQWDAPRVAQGGRR